MNFTERHIGPSSADQRSMLQVLGYDSLDDLTAAAVPDSIRLDAPLVMDAGVSEAEVQQEMLRLASANNPGRAMIGLGYYGTITPPVVRRRVLENPAWYTAYTPYQPEISQGRLEALLNFQTLIAELTALPMTGSSLLDEGTAVAEAVALARRQTRKGSVVLVDVAILPQSLGVLQTRALAQDIEVVVTDDLVDGLQRHDAFAVVVQSPGADGDLRSLDDLTLIAQHAHDNNALVIAAADLLALTLLTPPGEWGADIAVGSSQRFGVPLFYGGPHAGYIAVRAGMERQLPGRLVGLSKDRHGTDAFRLALQTREQHIRREKATSNICTAQVLLAITASMYAVHHGPDGLREVAREVVRKVRLVAANLVAGGITPRHQHFFDTLTVDVPGRADAVVQAARAGGVHLRRVDADAVGVSVGEDARLEDLKVVVEAFGLDWTTDEGQWGSFGQPERPEGYLPQRVFHSYRSETDMLRYMRLLQDRDFALDRGMIPLGSCTMKLNPAAALEAISYEGFANLHPFVPIEDAAGYTELIARLESALAEVTGYARVNLQPNAGSQGEFAGLMAVRSYHLANGDEARNICLIPSSAHGTNAASAAMAGMSVVVVKSASDGSVDMADLEAKIDANRDRLAVIMVTYPSTHGVFEDTIAPLCERVHAAGGQVYIDGANMNALMGLAKPGRFGGDVSHLNLHKTFAIPHGGGGPGVGPVAVGEHLAPYLPNHPLLPEAGPETSYGPISAAPFGSAGVLPITFGYIALMGGEGLRQSSQVAILSANYLKHRLAERYPVLYAGENGLVAHECIVDLRPLTKQTGVTVDDVAKRLVDYGFHAPTMSFPVAGTLMIEPTESEPLAELDRFVDAMLSIADEAARLHEGEWPTDDNPLVNAPHTLAEVAGDEWPHPYPRSLAGFPAGHERGAVQTGAQDKYWPAVARIDGPSGDRNFVCSCPPLEEWL